jgi:glycosyltransferase involved in cell wall biosynthesis
MTKVIKIGVGLMNIYNKKSKKKLVLVAVIPAYNEVKFISNVILIAQKYVDKVIVIDDGSTDDTQEIARKCGAIVHSNEKNVGKWFALKRGFSLALEMEADIVITLDGDGQHNPHEIPEFLKALLNGADVAIGVRKYKGKMPLIRKASNFLTTSIINSLFSLKISDSQCGYRAYSRKAVKDLEISSEGYEGETESIIRLGKTSLTIEEVPIQTLYGVENSKMSTARDTWRFLKTVFSMKIKGF